MTREIRNSKSQSERQNPEQRSTPRKNFRKGHESRQRPQPKVNGIKAVHRIKDDEEKLLSRRPRLKSSDENRDAGKRPGRKSYGEDKFPPRGPRYKTSDDSRDNGRRPERKSYGEEKFSPRGPRFKTSDDGRDAGRRPEQKPYGEDKYSSREPRFKGSADNRDTGKKPGPRSYGEEKYSTRGSRFIKSGDERDEGKKSGRKPYEEKNIRTRPENNRKPTLIRKRSVKRHEQNPSENSDGIRLNRFIANAGICSRREADRYIETGVITVNGKIVTELGIKVTSSDEVKFDGRKLIAEKKVYLLLNKPKNFVTTTDDPHAEKTVMDLIKDACPERVYPVGRLDRNTTGLLLFTNDGELSKHLTHPSHINKKIYQVTLDKPATKQDIQQIADGIELEDGLIAADAISFIDQENKTEIGIEIHSGKNRVVRRMFEHLGYNIKKLDRVYYAGLTKKNLPRGKWRFLSPKEISFLKMK